LIAFFENRWPLFRKMLPRHIFASAFWLQRKNAGRKKTAP